MQVFFELKTGASSSRKNPLVFMPLANRKGDGEPGVQTLWIGLQRVKDFALAIQIHDGLIPKQRLWVTI